MSKDISNEGNGGAILVLAAISLISGIIAMGLGSETIGVPLVISCGLLCAIALSPLGEKRG